MIVIPLSRSKRALLFSSGSITLTGLTRLDSINSEFTDCIKFINTKLTRMYGPSARLHVTDPFIKTILAKTKFTRFVSWENVVTEKIAGVQDKMVNLRNGFTIRRDNVSVNIFQGTGSTIVFGKDFDQMKSVLSNVHTDLLHMQSKYNAPYYSDLLAYHKFAYKEFRRKK